MDNKTIEPADIRKLSAFLTRMSAGLFFWKMNMNNTTTRADHWVHQFRHDIACLYGVDEAIMLNHIVYWVQHNFNNGTGEHDGEFWSYNSRDAFARQFQFWSVMQIRRILKSCETQGLIKTGNFNKSAYDKTLWYTLTDKAWEAFGYFKPNHLLILTNGSVETNKPIPVLKNIIKQNTVFGETGELNLPVEQETTRPDVCQQIVDRYNEAAVVGKFPQCRKLTPDIRNKIKARLKDHPSPRDWKPVWEAVKDMVFLWETEKPTWFDLGYIIRSEDTFSKVARNFMAWKKKQPGQDRPANQYFAGEDSAMRRAIAKRTVKVAADGTITMPEENV